MTQLRNTKPILIDNNQKVLELQVLDWQTYDEVPDDFDPREVEWTYDISRLKEYPHFIEQLDMLWHAIDAGTLDKTSDFYTKLKAVKDKYPKG